MGDVIKCSPIQAKEAIMAMEGLKPFMLFGSPGIGKSDTVKQIAEDVEFELIDVRGTMLQPSDIYGIPVPIIKDDVAKWFRPEWLPTNAMLEDVRRKGKKGIILFLDELPSSIPAVQVAMQQLLLDRRVGNHILPDPEFCWIIAAGNQITDKAVHFKLPSPVADRLICMTIEATLDGWLSWAARHDVHPLVTAFHRSQGGTKLAPELVVEDSGYAFPTPRGWATVSDIMKKASRTDENTRRLMVFGTVGAGAGGEFMAFAKLEKELPDIHAMLKGEIPPSCPKQPDVLHVMASALGSLVTKENLGKFMDIVDILPKEYGVVAYGDAVEKSIPGIMTHAKSRKFQKELTPLVRF